MNKFFHQTDFKFSNDATQWILNRYQDRFGQTFHHDLDIMQINSQYDWQSSLPGKELINFLNTYNCNTKYYGINVFVSNTDRAIKSNPHVDTKFSIDGPARIKSRFNVMVLGNPSDPMVWWQDYEYNDPRFIDLKFTNLAGREYSSKGIPGNDPIERWEYLKEPTLEFSNLLTSSAFVKTDCAHAVILSPGPRLIVTVAINKSIEEITKALD